MYMSHRHEEGLAHLLYALESNNGFIVLSGEVGTGKTTLSRCLIERLPGEIDVAMILNPQLGPAELVASICDELGVQYERGNLQQQGLTRALNRHLLDSHAAGRRTLLIIDEAQQLSVAALEQVRLLTNLETTRQKLLQIILIGQPELRDLLGRHDLRQLSQRVTARYHLEGLSQRDTPAYVLHRLAVSGCGQALFSRGALREVHRLSNGIPRVVNMLCDRTLLGGYAQRNQHLTAAMVRRAAREIGGEQPTGKRSPRGAAWGVAAIALVVVIGLTQFGPWDIGNIQTAWLKVTNPEPAHRNSVGPPIAHAASVEALNAAVTEPKAPPNQNAVIEPAAELVSTATALPDPTTEQVTASAPVVESQPKLHSATSPNTEPKDTLKVVTQLRTAPLIEPRREQGPTITSELGWVSEPEFISSTALVQSTTAESTTEMEPTVEQQSVAALEPALSPAPEAELVTMSNATANQSPGIEATAGLESGNQQVSVSVVEPVQPPATEVDPLRVGVPSAGTSNNTSEMAFAASSGDQSLQAQFIEPPSPTQLELFAAAVDIADRPVALVTEDNELARILAGIGSGTKLSDAFIPLYKLWDNSGKTQVKCSIGGSLRCLIGRGDFSRLEGFNRPAILKLADPKGRTHFVTIVAIVGDRLEIEIADALLSFRRAEFTPFWTGDFLLLWRPPMAIPTILRAGMRGSQVVWLRDKLAQALGEWLPADDEELFDQQLRSQIITFQQSHGISVDGIVGIQTLVQLSAMAEGPTGPALKR